MSNEERSKVGILAARIPILREMMRECSLCPRDCRVNRLAGETGFCGLGVDAVLEQPPPDPLLEFLENL